MNIKVSITALLIVVLASCQKEEKKNDNNETKFDTSILYGEWYNNLNDAVIDLSFAPTSFSGSVYHTEGSSLVKFEDWSGMWFYTAQSQVLTMEILHSSTGQRTTHDYQIINSNSYLLTLRDRVLGSEDKFHKVVEAKTLSVGSEFDINYLNTNNISATGYVSSHSSIASVDSSGHVTANNKGVAFISITAAVGALIVKVEVN